MALRKYVAKARLAQFQAGIAVDHQAAVLTDQPVADAAADALEPGP